MLMTTPLIASIGTQASYLRSGFWASFGMSPFSFNLTTTGTGSQTVNRELIYDIDGFSGLNGGGTDIDGLSPARRALVEKVLQDISSKFNISFRRVLSTDPIGNVDLFFMDSISGAFTGSTLFSSGNIDFGENHGYIDYSWINVDPGYYQGSNTNNDYVYQGFYQKILRAIGLGNAGPYHTSFPLISNQLTVSPNNHIYLNDSWEMSIMSGFSQSDNNSLPGGSVNFLITMMAADVDALRAYYGSNMAFVGNTIYGVNTNIKASTNYMLANLSTFAGTNAFCLVDDGGIDTVDFSNYSCDQRLDLTVRGPNDISNFGNTTSDVGGLIRNMTLAAGTLIENATLGSGNDMITGNVANNLLRGGAGNDIILGLWGNDTLDGGLGIDTMVGGIGNDVFFVQTLGDIALEDPDSGTDRVEASITYTLEENIENLILIAYSDINGTGNRLDNTISGNTFDNILDGGIGVDTLTGGLGDDTYIVDNTADIVKELQGQGFDRVKSSVTYSLRLVDIEDLILTGDAPINGTGSRLHNVITGNTSSNILDGLAGLDTLRGGLGDDTYIVDNPGDVAIESWGNGTDLIVSNCTYKLPDNIENLSLSYAAGNSKATGNSLNNHITGNSGHNILVGELGADTMEGGLGNDTYIVDDAADIVIEAKAAGADIVESSISFILSENVETLRLTGFDQINGSGNNLSNSIIGNSANNILNGRGGGDRLTGGAGTDIFVLQFGESSGNHSGNSMDTITDFEVGIDRIMLLSLSNGVIESPANFLRAADNSSASTILELAAAVFADADGLTSGSQPLGLNSAVFVSSVNSLIAGNYILFNDGIAGYQRLNDILITLNPASGSIPTVGTNSDSLATWFIVDELSNPFDFPHPPASTSAPEPSTYFLDANLQNLSLISFSNFSNVNGVGNALNNLITGNAYNNTLDGAEGADTLVGGLGDDIYIVDNASDIVREFQGQGFDRVESSVTYSLGTFDVEALVLTGDDSINATGNTLHNVITGNTSNNILDGLVGLDTLIGGLGDDIYIVDNPGDVVIELEGSGTDLILSGCTYTLPNNVENLKLTIAAGSSKVTGNILDNYISGNGGANILDGSFGADTLEGFTGNDIYIVDNEGDTIIEIENGDYDLVLSSVSYTLPYEVDRLTLTGDVNLNGTGNNRDNFIVGNLGNNILNGGGRADRLTGLAGSDVFVFQFGESRATDAGTLFDTVTDFEVGIDRFDFLASSGGAITAPSGFWRAADNSSASTITSLVSAVFADVDSLSAGPQPLTTNTAVLVTSDNPHLAGNYLLVNDGVPGFQWQSDLFVKVNLVNGSLPVVGIIPSDTFVSWFC
jgi:Ca2+-binding RTX toxin-like protein